MSGDKSDDILNRIESLVKQRRFVAGTPAKSPTEEEDIPVLTEEVPVLTDEAEATEGLPAGMVLEPYQLAVAQEMSRFIQQRVADALPDLIIEASQVFSAQLRQSIDHTIDAALVEYLAQQTLNTEQPD